MTYNDESQPNSRSSRRREAPQFLSSLGLTFLVMFHGDSVDLYKNNTRRLMKGRIWRDS